MQRHQGRCEVDAQDRRNAHRVLARHSSLGELVKNFRNSLFYRDSSQAIELRILLTDSVTWFTLHTNEANLSTKKEKPHAQ